MKQAASELTAFRDSLRRLTCFETTLDGWGPPARRLAQSATTAADSGTYLAGKREGSETGRGTTLATRDRPCRVIRCRPQVVDRSGLDASEPALWPCGVAPKAVLSRR